MAPSDHVDLGKPQFESHKWLEPMIVLSIMIGSLIINRRRNFSIQHPSDYSPLGHPDDAPRTPDNIWQETSNAETYRVAGIVIKVPDSSRWRRHIHSRILQKFPFLVEMFYWVMNFLFYACTKAISQTLAPADKSVVQVAQDHAIDILTFEHTGLFNSFFPVEESEFQAYFIEYHPLWLTLFNRIYSLVHIPGTVLFISWYYYSAPNHRTFAIVRRTMTLGNLAAFLVFCIYPCMPPRLLPKEYHFYDTVRQDHAESIWVGAKSVNQFAAMPSLHFTYAFVIGCTFIYHSGIMHRWPGMSTWPTTIFYLTLGIIYPLLVLSVIVATANHYWLDAAVAVLTVTVCFLGNRILVVLLPLEYFLCWGLRLAKPVPTTGDRWNDYAVKDTDRTPGFQDGVV
ncbi:PAP2 superfamily-domain-containing protein [Aspergillus coremiiformis]|uniref:PAP2 superfamily-domain-containing protein n=1 Tax=Aspergillus coremiiformis TaxID=138285 RepID=A0A5N6Z853_9EURO|nr:PAP2 superfamily-domain-containing protein [Aspergillus coremiiformis]